MIFEEQYCSTNTHLFESTEKQDENSFSARIEGMWTCLHEIQYGILLQIWHWHNALQFGTYFHNMLVISYTSKKLAWDMKPIWAGLSKNGEPMGGPSKLYCMVEHYFPNWNSHIIYISYIYTIYIYIIYIYTPYIYIIYIYVGGKSTILDKTRYHINCYKHTHTYIYMYTYIYSHVHKIMSLLYLAL